MSSKSAVFPTRTGLLDADQMAHSSGVERVLRHMRCRGMQARCLAEANPVASAHSDLASAQRGRRISSSRRRNFFRRARPIQAPVVVTCDRPEAVLRSPLGLVDPVGQREEHHALNCGARPDRRLLPVVRDMPRRDAAGRGTGGRTLRRPVVASAPTVCGKRHRSMTGVSRSRMGGPTPSSAKVVGAVTARASPWMSPLTTLRGRA